MGNTANLRWTRKGRFMGCRGEWLGGVEIEKSRCLLATDRVEFDVCDRTAKAASCRRTPKGRAVHEVLSYRTTYFEGY